MFDLAQKPIHIFAHVDLQHTFHFDLDINADPYQVHTKDFMFCMPIVGWVVLCVLYSAQPTSPISPYMVPVHYIIIVYMQYTL